ncbi:MAG: metallo-beta-lactamase [Microscillaceae bacterium]|nr:metallo-beta-lactamase [Microscillaceae bacterium]
MKSPKTLLIALFLQTLFIQLSAQEIYTSASLKITQIGEQAFVHTTYLNTTDFGKVPCNGLIFKSGQEAIVLDTPPDDSTSLELIQWIENKLGAKVKTVIPTHFHDDCLGGLEAFHKHHISSLAHTMTIDLAQKNENLLPQKGFKKKYTLKLGDKKVFLGYHGEGHTRDNIIAYIPLITSEKSFFIKFKII